MSPMSRTHRDTADLFKALTDYGYRIVDVRPGADGLPGQIVIAFPGHKGSWLYRIRRNETGLMLAYETSFTN
jgi:hypothetical protein